MRTTRAVPTTNETTPSLEMRMLTPSDSFVMSEVIEQGVPKDWSKIEAYTQGSFAVGSTVRHLPMRAIWDACILTHADLDHVRAIYYTNDCVVRHLLPSGRVSNAVQCDNLFMLSQESNLTAQAGLFTFSAYHLADLKPKNIIQVYADLLEQVSDPLKGYEKYQTANWDGRGAEAICTATLGFARKLMSVMPTVLGSPDIAPAADGTIALEWVPDHHHRLSKLFLDIGPEEEWTAYWKMNDGHFDTVTHQGFHPVTTKAILQDLFDHLSK